jgi:hypothetical protein
MDAAGAVDQLLRSRHGTDLEQVLGEGCMIGVLPAALTGVAQIAPRRVNLIREEDGGESSIYDGMLVLGDCRYRFRIHLFVDFGGLWFLSDIESFDAVEWKIRLAV